MKGCTHTHTHAFSEQIMSTRTNTHCVGLCPCVYTFKHTIYLSVSHRIANTHRNTELNTHTHTHL